MKKLIRIIALILIMVMAGSAVAYADFPVLLDGEFVDVETVVRNDRTLLPARAMVETLGGQIYWDAATRQVTKIHENTTVVLTIDSNIALVNGVAATLDVPAKIINDRTFLPLRFVGESLGLDIDFYAGARTVIVNTANNTFSEAELREIARTGIPMAEMPMLPNFSIGFVERVIDGDTIVLSNGERVRFIGIDAPEIGEPGAAEATQFVRDMIYGQTVWLEASGDDRDRFDRLRRYIWIQKPTDPRDPVQIQTKQLNAMMLAYGLAVPFVVLNNQTTPPQYTTTTPGTGSYIGNINSQIFHVSSCSTLPAPQNRIYFETREQAIEAGHRPCQRCRP